MKYMIVFCACRKAISPEKGAIIRSCSVNVCILVKEGVCVCVEEKEDICRRKLCVYRSIEE